MSVKTLKLLQNKAKYFMIERMKGDWRTKEEETHQPITTKHNASYDNKST